MRQMRLALCLAAVFVISGCDTLESISGSASGQESHVTMVHSANTYGSLTVISQPSHGKRAVVTLSLGGAVTFNYPAMEGSYTVCITAIGQRLDSAIVNATSRQFWINPTQGNSYSWNITSDDLRWASDC